MTHTQLVEAAKEAIQEVFGDTSVNPLETYASLKDLQDELEILMDAVPK